MIYLRIRFDFTHDILLHHNETEDHLKHDSSETDTLRVAAGVMWWLQERELRDWIKDEARLTPLCCCSGTRRT
jgi:hypothetical protein